MKYIFGVMDNKWSLESDDMIMAYIVMSVFIKQNIPVAVYEPQKYSFMPKDILDINEEYIEGKSLYFKKVFLSIKEEKIA